MIRNRPALILIRLVLGGLFVYAGFLKITETLEFAQDIRNYRLVGQSLSFLTAVFLPWLEVVAGFFLVAGIMKRASALLVSSMLVFFILLALVTIIRGIDVDCGCFGALSRRAGPGLVLEDLLMLGMALSLLFERKPARP
jgi:uncharacterized membrane protein YphA (DoxX/SURF4 family)